MKRVEIPDTFDLYISSEEPVTKLCSVGRSQPLTLTRKPRSRSYYYWFVSVWSLPCPQPRFHFSFKDSWKVKTPQFFWFSVFWPTTSGAQDVWWLFNNTMLDIRNAGAEVLICSANNNTLVWITEAEIKSWYFPPQQVCHSNCLIFLPQLTGRIWHKNRNKVLSCTRSAPNWNISSLWTFSAG